MSLPSTLLQGPIGAPNALALPPEIPALDNTLGAILIGTSIGLIFYGLTVHQTYRYFRLYPTDSALIRSLVIVLLVLETFHTACCIHMCYYYLVSNYFNPTALLSGVWSMRLLAIVTGTVIFVCHSFYARRIFCMGSRYKLVVALVVVLMFGELAFVIASTVESFIQVTFAKWEKYTWLISSGFGFAVAADILLTTTLIIILRTSRTGIKATDSILDVLIIYTINTGLLTGLFSLLSLIFAVAYPNNMIYIGLNMVSTRTYANSVLAFLNSRRSFHERTAIGLEAGAFGSSTPQDDSRTTLGQRQAGGLRVYPGVLEIKIVTDTQQMGGSEDFEVEEMKETVRRIRV